MGQSTDGGKLDFSSYFHGSWACFLGPLVRQEDIMAGMGGKVHLTLTEKQKKGGNRNGLGP